MTDVTCITKRGDRYKEILPLEKLANSRVFVAGCGAVGRVLAIQLVTMGVEQMTLCDKDVVEDGNLGPQGWHHAQLGKSKVEALAETLRAINPACQLTLHDAWFEPRMLETAQYTFSCVDRMEARKALLEASVAKARRLAFRAYYEARMSAETCEVRSVWNDDSAKAWLAEWYPQTEVFQEGCTAKSTHYCASMAAVLLVSAFTKSLRGLPLTPMVGLNIKADEMTVVRAWPEPKTEDNPATAMAAVEG